VGTSRLSGIGASSHVCGELVEARDATLQHPAKPPSQYWIAGLRRTHVAREWDALGSNAKEMPATNLHVHFGGSIPAETVARFTPYTGAFEEALERISRKQLYVPDAKKGLAPYLQHYTPTSRAVPLPDPKYAREVARDIAYNYAKDNVVVAELRINPFRDFFSIHRVPPNELSSYSEAYTRAIAAGLNEGSEAARAQGLSPTHFGVIFDGNRFTPGEKDPKESLRKAAIIVDRMYEEAIRQVKIDGNPMKVCAVGICGLEEGHPATAFKSSIDKIHAHNKEMIESGQPDKVLGISIHAGEVGTSEEASKAVLDAIMLASSPHTPVGRIGHGVLASQTKVKEGVEAMGVRLSDVHFEICPTSNFQIIKELDENAPHPGLAFENKSINSDNDALSGPVGKEARVAGASPSQAAQMVLDGISWSFRLSQLGIKDEVLEKTNQKFRDLGIDL